MLVFNILAIMPFIVSLSWLVSSLLVFKESDKPKRNLLWFIVMCTGFQFARMLRLAGTSDYLEVASCMYIFFGLSIYPAAYLYIHILTTMCINWKRVKLWKWICLTLNTGVALLYCLTLDARWSDQFTFIFLSIEVIMFSVIGLRTVTNYRRQLLNFYSNEEGMYLKSLVVIFIVFMILSAIKTASLAFSLPVTSNIWFIGFFSISVTIVIFAVAYSTARRKISAHDLQIDINEEAQTEKTEPGIDTAELTRHEVAEKILNVMDKERLFLKPGLSIIDVARAVGSNRTYVSESINSVMNQSFNDFINNMRVSYAMDLLRKSPTRCISDIAFESGFASDAAFYRNFRKFSGESPSLWLSKNLRVSN